MLSNRRTGRTAAWTSLVGLIVGALLGTLLIVAVGHQSSQDSIAGAGVGAIAFLIISLLTGLRARR